MIPVIPLRKRSMTPERADDFNVVDVYDCRQHSGSLLERHGGQYEALIRRGELPSILIGRRRLIRRQTLADWLAGREQHPHASADRQEGAGGMKQVLNGATGTVMNGRE